MTKKDYQLIADALDEAWCKYRDEDGGSAISGAAHELADRLAATNPRFNRDTFLTACGFGS